jgi:hypothetical protein
MGHVEKFLTERNGLRMRLKPVITQRCGAQFGYHITYGKTAVGELRVQEDANGDNRMMVLDLGGVESLPRTAEDVQESLSARGYYLIDLTDVEHVVEYVNSYGVRVYRDPHEPARFRMEFVNGPRRGQIFEVDVRDDGVPVADIPEDWQPMTGMAF